MYIRFFKTKPPFILLQALKNSDSKKNLPIHQKSY